MRTGSTERLRGVFTSRALASIFLSTSAFLWYSYAIVLLQENISHLSIDYLTNMLVWSAHFGALILSAILGASLTKRSVDRTRFLGIWILVGTLASLTPLVLSTSEPLGTTALGIILGISLGFGMPNCMGYFTQVTPIENRGRIGGLMFVLSGLSIVVLDMTGISGVVSLTAALVVLRGISLLAIPFATSPSQTEYARKPLSYRSLVVQKSFILYLVPWIMFSLLNYLTTPVQENILDNPIVFANMQLLQNVFIAIFALVGGVFMDKVGRKRLAIIGFVLQGLSFSFVGLINSPSIPYFQTVWYFHSILNGVSWGVLCVLFVTTIWGDLSHEMASDKFYALGVSPFFISKMLQVVINAEIVTAIDVTTIFSFSALFLFLAVLPLVYAPETLPEKIMKDRELNTYIEKAQKIAAEIQKEKEEEKVEEAEIEFGVPQEDAEDAEKLAEKYY